MDGHQVVREEVLLKGVLNQRVRDVEQGPDGYIYLLTDEDNGKLLRLEPAG
jgi:glucose/arabinose dehydrogenase